MNCRDCGKSVAQSDQGIAQSSVMDFLCDERCPKCYMQRFVRPIDKEIAQCEATLGSLRSARHHAFNKLEQAKQDWMKQRDRIQALFKVTKNGLIELRWWCKCGRGFAKEPDYVAHVYSCTGKAPETRKQQAVRATKQEKAKNLREVSI